MQTSQNQKCADIIKYMLQNNIQSFKDIESNNIIEIQQKQQVKLVSHLSVTSWQSTFKDSIHYTIQYVVDPQYKNAEETRKLKMKEDGIKSAPLLKQYTNEIKTIKFIEKPQNPDSSKLYLEDLYIQYKYEKSTFIKFKTLIQSIIKTEVKPLVIWYGLDPQTNQQQNNTIKEQIAQDNEPIKEIQKKPQMLKLFPSFIPPCSSYSQVKTTNIVSDALPLSIEENKESQQPLEENIQSIEEQSSIVSVKYSNAINKKSSKSQQQSGSFSEQLLILIESKNYKLNLISMYDKRINKQILLISYEKRQQEDEIIQQHYLRIIRNKRCEHKDNDQDCNCSNKYCKKGFCNKPGCKDIIKKYSPFVELCSYYQAAQPPINPKKVQEYIINMFSKLWIINSDTFRLIWDRKSDSTGLNILQEICKQVEKIIKPTQILEYIQDAFVFLFTDGTRSNTGYSFSSNDDGFNSNLRRIPILQDIYSQQVKLNDDQCRFEIKTVEQMQFVNMFREVLTTITHHQVEQDQLYKDMKSGLYQGKVIQPFIMSSNINQQYKQPTDSHTRLLRNMLLSCQWKFDLQPEMTFNMTKVMVYRFQTQLTKSEQTILNQLNGK